MASRLLNTLRSWRSRAGAARSAVTPLDELNVLQWITTIRATKDTILDLDAYRASVASYAEFATRSLAGCATTPRHLIAAASTSAGHRGA